MTRTMQPTQQLSRTVRVTAKVLSIVVVIAGLAVFVTLPMSWVEEPYVISHGPILSFVIAIAAMLTADLLDKAGPRVRWSERRAFRAEVAAYRAQGMSQGQATSAARPPYAPRTRAARIIGGGVLSAALGAVELWLVAYNLDNIRTRGFTPAFAPDLASIAGWALVVIGVTAVIIGIVGMSVTPGSLPAAATGAVPAAFVTSTPFVASHRVPDSPIPAYATPAPGTPVAMLDPRLSLMVIEGRGDWTHVRAENGWEGWVDGRQLVSLTSAPPVPQIPPMPVG